MTRVSAISRREAEATVFTDVDAVISISDPTSPGFPGSPAPKINGTPHVIHIRLDDCGETYDQPEHRDKFYEAHKRYPYFLTVETALAVIVFAKAHAAAGRMITVHCEAGLSRSVGMADALSLIINGEMGNPFDRHPNARIKSTMLRAAGLVHAFLPPVVINQP